MSYYTNILRQRVQRALAGLLERAQWGRDLATVLRELAGDLHLPVELRPPAPGQDIDVLRHRVRQALTSLLTVERTHFARELAMLLRELADELDPPRGPGDDEPL